MLRLIWEFERRMKKAFVSRSGSRARCEAGNVEPHDVAILVRMRADEVEAQLSPHLKRAVSGCGTSHATSGDIAIQDLLGEDLTHVLLRLLRLGAAERSPGNWNAALRDLQFFEAVDPYDEAGLQRLQQRLQKFVRENRRAVRRLDPVPDSAAEVAQAALDFVGAQVLRQAFPSYQQPARFRSCLERIHALLRESSRTRGNLVRCSG